MGLRSSRKRGVSFSVKLRRGSGGGRGTMPASSKWMTSPLPRSTVTWIPSTGQAYPLSRAPPPAEEDERPGEAALGPVRVLEVAAAPGVHHDRLEVPHAPPGHRLLEPRVGLGQTLHQRVLAPVLQQPSSYPTDQFIMHHRMNDRTSFSCLVQVDEERRFQGYWTARRTIAGWTSGTTRDDFTLPCPPWSCTTAMTVWLEALL